MHICVCPYPRDPRSPASRAAGLIAAYIMYLFGQTHIYIYIYIHNYTQLYTISYIAILHVFVRNTAAYTCVCPRFAATMSE